MNDIQQKQVDLNVFHLQHRNIYHGFIFLLEVSCLIYDTFSTMKATVKITNAYFC